MRHGVSNSSVPIMIQQEEQNFRVSERPLKEKQRREVEMKIAWKKRSLPLTHYPNLPFDPQGEDEDTTNEIGKNPVKEKKKADQSSKALASEPIDSELHLAESFQSDGNKLAQDGRYQEALGKWEAALTLMPERAILHEQKAQVLLEIGDSWNALKAAVRATELEPTWAEAWITLARAQLNFGEPDAAIESFDRALAIKPDCEEAKDDRQTALHLVKRRKQLHLSGLSTNESRYAVKDKEAS